MLLLNSCGCSCLVGLQPPFDKRGDRVNVEQVVPFEAAPAVDLSAVLDAISCIKDASLAMITLLSLMATLLILLLFAGGWGNG